MARKTLTYTVADEGRDKGKVFVITEMPSSHGERWAIRAMLGMAKGGVEVPENFMDLGWAGLAQLGLTLIASMPPETALPLLEEMMLCVAIMPNPSNPSVVRALVEDDIEEIKTRVKLKKAAFDLHANFSSVAASLTSGQAAASGAAA